MAGSPKKRARRAIEAAAAAATRAAVSAVVAAGTVDAIPDTIQRTAAENNADAHAAANVETVPNSDTNTAENAGDARSNDTSAAANAAEGGKNVPNFDTAEGENRSAIFPTAEAFRAAADAYFADCDACGKLYGEAGLCLWLSAHNPGRRRVTLETLRRWYDGERCAYLAEEVQMAFLKIQDQIDTDPRYHNKAMISRAIFLQKQTRLGGYQDKVEEKTDATVRIILGDGVDTESFQ